MNQTSLAIPAVPGEAAKAVAIALLSIFAIIWIAWSAAANSDAANGRQVLYMDELITYDGIGLIQKAKPKDLLANVVGTDHRYGRPTWYLPALATDPLAHDETGRIVATRMFFALSLFAALFLIAVALIETWPWRAAAIASAAVTPYAVYYATMPKPEPLMLMFLATFLVLMVRRGQNLGLSWALLGLAFGMKISLAPALPLLFAVALGRDWGSGRLNAKRLALRSALSFAVFLGGWFAAVPVLLTPNGFNTYLDYTWRNTAHPGDDDITVTPLSWLQLMAQEHFFGAGPLAWVSVALIAVTVLAALVYLARELSNGKAPRLRTMAADRIILLLTVMAIGVMMLASIMIGVKRFWGNYLFPGAVLVLFGVFGVLEQLAARGDPKQKTIFAAVAGAIFLLAIAPGAGDTIASFKELSLRSKQKSFVEKVAQYKAITGNSETLAKTLRRPIRVLVQAGFPSATTTANVQYDQLFGVRNVWIQDYELVFLPKDENPETLKTKTNDYAAEIAEYIAQRQDHIAASPGQPCKISPCFVALPGQPNGLFAWRRVGEGEAAK